MYAFVQMLSNARAKKYHKPHLLQTDGQITKNQDAWLFFE
jgi:hypothetical protein